MSTVAVLRNQIRAAIHGEGIDNNYAAGRPLVKDTLQLAHLKVAGEDIEGSTAKIRHELLSASGGDPDQWEMSAPYKKEHLETVADALGVRPEA